MPRFHISVLNDSFYLADDEGVELPDLATALRQARKAAGEIIGDELMTGSDAIHLTLTIDDERGRTLASLNIVTTMTATVTEEGNG